MSALSASAFVAFLRTRAAVPIRLDALLWLVGATAVRPRNLEDSLANGLAALLAEVLGTQEPDLRRSPQSFEAFRELLRKLCDRNHPEALEIRETLQRSR